MGVKYVMVDSTTFLDSIFICTPNTTGSGGGPYPPIVGDTVKFDSNLETLKPRVWSQHCRIPKLNSSAVPPLLHPSIPKFQNPNLDSVSQVQKVPV